MGGILVWGRAEDKIRILNNKIVYNTRVGIHCVGENSEVFMEGNKIESNMGPGIKIGIANKSKIVRNEIKNN